LIASKSSTLLNVPYDFRIAKILSAVDGPIPGTSCNSPELAVFRFIGCDGGFFFANPVGTKQIVSASKQKRLTRNAIQWRFMAT